MKEDLLQYIWKFQRYQLNELTTTSGDRLQIIHPGIFNTNQGPDFLEAKIKINDTTWAGNIELHINSSHWNQHRHSGDQHFNNVILHVVWNHDMEIPDASGVNLPTLELQSRVSKLLLAGYRQLMESPGFISCEKQVLAINDLTLSAWKQRLIVERLLKKAEAIRAVFKQTNDHWEETFWWLIAANFGGKINGPVFQKVAQSLPLTLLAKHKNNVIGIEALLLGQAGLLKNNFSEKYPQMLQKEYNFLCKKYQLKAVDGQLCFLRMRPANFPSIRLAQLAMLIHKSEHFFSKIKEADSLNEVEKMLAVDANDYWHYHYLLDDIADFKIKRLGKQMTGNILINTIVPLLFAYGLHYNKDDYKEKAIQWLQEIARENNSITKGFELLGFSNQHAGDSQFLLQLKNEYCEHKFCLQCAIGNSLLKNQASANTPANLS
jgi:Protein of unknown function (DUF2851)